MSDITARLQSLRAQVAELAQMVGHEQADTAQALAGKVDEALEELAQELSSRQGTPPGGNNKVTWAPRQEVMACPRCSLRSFHFEKGSIRSTGDAGDEFEALYRCRSCGFSQWQEVSPPRSRSQTRAGP